MLRKILIANRGEIACRIIKTAQQLGIECVAIYSSADQESLHVKLANEAYWVGEPPSNKSYLQFDKIIDVAKKSNCQGIHPGYGFLSENANFSQACEANGIVFIGPSSASIVAMGDKAKAKQRLEKTPVPLVPGYHGNNQDETYLQQQAEQIGYPILLKAAAGGGGKGMRVVEEPGQFISSLHSAKREAMASFADDTFIIEKFIQQPRHIEIQIFADQQDNYVHLFERDCSIQRRHQKVIEESPAPGISVELRNKMGKAAIAVAQSVNYRGAGTVEFLVDKNHHFYFMEMNTRLQVEHPITELITGVDLVQWQLLVANNQPLPLSQEQLKITGHAIEARIYAEDPDNDFLPSIGKLMHLVFPQETKHVRIDTGIKQGDEISTYYDPMIAKLIVWDHDRDGAIKRMNAALWQAQIVGLKTNIGFLNRIIQIDDYHRAQLTTHFIEQHEDELFKQQKEDINLTLCLGTLYLLLKQNNNTSFQQSNDEFTPWNLGSNWRLNHSCPQQFDFIIDGEVQSIKCFTNKEGYLFESPAGKYLLNGKLLEENIVEATINEQKFQTTIIQQNNELSIFGHNFHHCLHIQTLDTINSTSDQLAGRLTSPMPGTVVSVLVEAEKKVDEGTALLIIEAMKMEHTIYAPSQGLVKKIHFKQGDLVNEGVELVEFESD